MEKFSYALEFYKNNIFNIENDNDVSIMKKAIMDAKKIEQHFSNVLNIDLLRENIIISFKFNKKLDCENRINYIRGIVYSRSYINFNDAIIFNQILNNLLYPIDDNIFDDDNDELIHKNDSNVSTIDIDNTIDYIDYSDIIDIFSKPPDKVIEYFKSNFKNFIKKILNLKNVPNNANNKERKYIIKGMKDWFTYIINMFDDIYNIYIDNLERNCTDLSLFI